MSTLKTLVEEYDSRSALSDEDRAAYSETSESFKSTVSEFFETHGYVVEGVTVEDYLDALDEALNSDELGDATAELVEGRELTELLGTLAAVGAGLYAAHRAKKSLEKGPEHPEDDQKPDSWKHRGVLNKGFHKLFKTRAWQSEKGRRDLSDTEKQAKLTAAKANLRRHQTRLANFGDEDSDTLRHMAATAKLTGKATAAARANRLAKTQGKLSRLELKNKIKAAKRAGSAPSTAPGTASGAEAGKVPERPQKAAAEAEQGTKTTVAKPPKAA